MKKYLIVGLVILLLLGITTTAAVAGKTYDPLERAQYYLQRAETAPTWAGSTGRASISSAYTNVLILEELQQQTELLRQIELNTRR